MPTTSKTPATARKESGGAGAQINELKDLVVGYAKQETIDPLKTLARYLGFGLTGSIFIGLGGSLLLLALLRGLQELDTFDGTFSWAPYLIATAAGLVLAGLFVAKLISLTRKRGQ